MRRKKDYRKVPSKHSAMVIEAKTRTLDLAAALAAQSGTAAVGLDDELRQVLEPGETMPDLRFLFELLERRLRRARQELDRADEQRFLEEMRVSVARHQAARAKDELYAEMVKVRKELVDLCGSPRARLQFGLSERTPRGATDLAFEARRIVDRLSTPGLQLPDAELPGLAFVPASWADGLRPALERLEDLLSEIAGRRMAVIDGIAECRQALESCDATYLRVARSAEALFVLSGQPELARRLRPKERRQRAATGAVGAAVTLSLKTQVKAAAGWTAHIATRFGRWWHATVRRATRGGFVTPLRARGGHPVHGTSDKTGVSALAERIPRAEIA